MATIRKAFVAVIVKSLLRGRSFIQAVLAFWFAPQSLQGKTNRAIEGSRSSKSLRSIQDFLKEAEELLLDPIGGDGLLHLSAGLKIQFRQGLRANPACMLPSFNHQLPTGQECGQYLALDVGGSTLRIALVELTPSGGSGSGGDENRSQIVRMMSFKIGPEVKSLEGMAFFDWMAERIVETISKDLEQEHSPDRPVPMSLAWSFPIEQTSLKGGRIQHMGKGFLAANGLLGQDLGATIKLACQSKGLSVELHAILNDSSAALLSKSYSHTSTRFGLILGTGVNIAAYLPVITIGRAKFGERSASWFNEASHVIVNTELGMFGKDILPLTRWDRALKAGHPRPDFQPLEHLVSGYYLGEVCRLALIEAVETTGLFGGVLPESLSSPYSLDTETLSIIESDATPTLEKAIAEFEKRYPSTVKPTTTDVAAVKALASFISRRSSAIIATCVYTLWDLRTESEIEYVKTLAKASPERVGAICECVLPQTMVAFNGSVIENYPRYLANCQAYVNELLASNGTDRGAIDLVAAKESSLIGAAVALAACIGDAK